jgi:hypothetical protein
MVSLLDSFLTVVVEHSGGLVGAQAAVKVQLKSIANGVLVRHLNKH